MKKSYWNGNGKYQDIVKQIEKDIIVLDNKDQNEYDKLTKTYYRYNNDGDLHHSIRKKAKNEGLTVEKYLENKVDILLEGFKNKYNL